MTLAQHAEQWYLEKGIDMPSAPDVYQAMYEQWVEWAFSDLHTPDVDVTRTP